MIYTELISDGGNGEAQLTLTSLPLTYPAFQFLHLCSSCRSCCCPEQSNEDFSRSESKFTRQFSWESGKSSWQRQVEEILWNFPRKLWEEQKGGQSLKMDKFHIIYGINRACTFCVFLPLSFSLWDNILSPFSCRDPAQTLFRKGPDPLRSLRSFIPHREILKLIRALMFLP